MRKFAMVAGFGLLAAACGGGEKAAEAPAAEAAPAAAPAAAAGASHTVEMRLDGSTYHYVPSELMIASGDQVSFVNVSGGPHNVQFWADSLPAGAKDVLNAGMPDRMGDLSGPLEVEPNVSYTISFANAPAGEYKFFCLPHLANKMQGKITVQ